jgi:hypothetical protein
MESSFPKLPRFGISFIDPTPFKSESNGYIAIYIYIIIQPRASFDPSSIFTASYLKKTWNPPKKQGFDPKKSPKTMNTMGPEECSFNVLEAFVSAVGMGDDLNAIIRTCPPPRDGESELACQVNGAILVPWVGNLATKLALAASNCALSTNVDAAPWIEMTKKCLWIAELSVPILPVLPCFECLMNV